MQEYHLEDKHLQVSKDMMKKLLDYTKNNPGRDSYRSPIQNENETMER